MTLEHQSEVFSRKNKSVSETKSLRDALTAAMQQLKGIPVINTEHMKTINQAEVNLQQALNWLGNSLSTMNEENPDVVEN